MILVTDFIPTLKCKLTLACLCFKKQTLKGQERSQSQITGGKKSPGKDSEAQKASEQQSQKKGVKEQSAQMSRHLRFCRM